MKFEQKLVEFIKKELCTDDSIYILVVAAEEQQEDLYNEMKIFKVRLAMTYKNHFDVNPYFDGTDLYVAVTPVDIRFTREDEWADGPPICEGSPIELAFRWVSELAPPIFVSPEAQEAAQKGCAALEVKQDGCAEACWPEDFDKWF